MNKTRNYIRILLLVLLLGGMASGAWAQTKKVTYHVITLPFCDESTNNIAYRIEAIKKTVTQNTADDIKLPADLKSPLMKDEAYSYYTDAGQSASLVSIFPDNPSTFYTYDFTNKTPINVETTKVGNVEGGDHIDIYVKYDWATEANRTDYGKELDLTGHKTYNIEFRTSEGSWFYALNMDNDRGNRGQSVPAEYLNTLTDLCSDNPVRIKQPARNKYIFYFKWKLTNDDPYNIILKTATNTGIDYKEDGYYKNNGGAQFYGSLSGASSIRSNWVTNEVNKAYDNKTKINWQPRHGWFRGTLEPWGRNSKDNGVLNHLYFSFSLLNRSTASEGDYTLAASWVKVNGDDWVPNSKGQYLLMQHEPVHDLPYAGPKFMDFTATDQVQFHEIRDYTYHVKTPFYPTAGDPTEFEKKEHTVSAFFKMSDYAADSLLTKYVPDSLKRKYTTIDGTYKENTLTTEMTTFQEAINNNKDSIKVNGRIHVWLKYSVVSSIPFKTYTKTTPSDELKWYNIYVNKEKMYTTWYDKNDSYKFNTREGSSGHTKYQHESHFAFIGDPYEFYVVNRQASEDASNLQYLKLNATTTDPLVSGTSDTYKYRPVPNGTTLTIGNTYYTSAEGAGQFIYYGKVADEDHDYYEKKYRFDPVAETTTLTADNYYYRSSAGDGTFKALGSEVADGSNYYQLVTYYDRVANGTNLTVGNYYYTASDGSDGGEYYYYEKSNGTNYYEKKFDSTWEIIYDNNSGNYADCFRLRQFNSFADNVTIGWGTSGSRPLNGDGGDGTNISKVARLSVLELPMMKYTYYIVDHTIAEGASGYPHIAVMATEEQIVGTALNYNMIPEVIRSPLLMSTDPNALEFRTYKDVTAFNLGITSIGNSDKYEKITMTNSNESAEYQNHIFVLYDTSKLDAMNGASGTPLIDDDSEAHSFNVIVNNEYIYRDGDNIIKSKPSLTGSEPSQVNNLWVLGGGDPYAFYIRNRGIERYVLVENEDGKPKWESNNVLGWTGTYPSPGDATRFIIKSGTLSNTYEVMATTGVVLDASGKVDFERSIDASKIYYNIGRTGTETVKMLKYDVVNREGVGHGYEQIRFQLKKSSARKITYILIDKTNTELLRENARQAIEESPQIPAEYFSPLVKEYTYWEENPIVDGKINEGKKKYGPKDTFKKYYKEGDADETHKSWEGTEDVFVWITYTTDDSKADLQHTTMYLLKFAQGQNFRQEDGSDGLLPKATDEEMRANANVYKAVYPYCNGDGNFNVYGQYQYDVQQEGAASTRTRWAWYLESGNDDPYHVRILSRQTETYNGLERSAYFATMRPTDHNEVITTLVWPNISGVQSTEYMILGSDHQYRLKTTYEVDENRNKKIDDGEKRYDVTTLEQYWKTYDLIRRKVLGQSKEDYPDKNTDPIEVPETPFVLTGTDAAGRNNRTYLEEVMGWNEYTKMAKAKRWNGYNADGKQSKGWESLKHWFQTIEMGSGYFDLIPTTIDAALILLDQHGWEIMRKPLPTSPDDPDKDKKYEVLRQYDSPMVKEYIFWASASKRSGFHQYYKLDKRIGGDFTSTSLTSLPPYDSENVHDSKGNHNDEYVTYIVKDEYALSYNPDGQVAEPFLVRQGDKLAKTGSKSINTVSVSPSAGGVSEYIITNIDYLGNQLWYVMPNADIDKEMGYSEGNHSWAEDAPNAYDDEVYGKYRVASIIEGASDSPAVKKYGRFAFSNGFDPYNIQFVSSDNAMYFTMNMTSATAVEGEVQGDYPGSTPEVELYEKQNPTIYNGTGYDNSRWYMTNQTFMAVQDADGNMQLMPRFDHTLRMRDFRTLVTPTAEAGDGDKLKETHTQLYRPYVYNYRIIDNTGHESLRYQSGGELLPQTPDHFKSPLAKDFKYYKDLTAVNGIYSLSGIASKQITSSLAGAGMSEDGIVGNLIYVRYAYDEAADVDDILKGKWLTMQLNERDVHYNTGIYSSNGKYSLTAETPAKMEELAKKLAETGLYYFKIEDPSETYMNVNVTIAYNGTTDAIYDTPTVASEADWSAAKPLTIDSDAKKWQWKFLKNPYTEPDPYAVQLFNRNQKNLPMSVNNMGETATASSSKTYQHYALLSHTDNDGKADGYALALARVGRYTYSFLNGYGVSTVTPAIITEDLSDYSAANVKSGFTSTAGVFHANDTRVQLTDEVTDIFTYHVYTHGTNGSNEVKYGSRAISAKQTYSEAMDFYNFVPTLPDEARSPLLNPDDFVYYEEETDMGDPNKELDNLYGLYDGNVYVRYTYDPAKSNYKVPNEKAVKEGHVARGDNSNDSPLRFGEKMLYNIVWFDNATMKSNNTAIDQLVGDDNLQYTDPFVWQFMGNDPYAIKIRNKATGTYMYESESNTCNLAAEANATTFMLLSRSDGHQYGMLAKTGADDITKTTKLTGYGSTLTGVGDDAPTKFIIFALSTLKVVYHLVIANIGNNAEIPWRTYKSSIDAKKEETGRMTWNDTDGSYGAAWDAVKDNKQINGTTMRELNNAAFNLGNLSNYYYDFGPVSLGENLAVPESFYRPNVVYTFFIGGIQDKDGHDTEPEIVALNTLYKGLEIKSKEMSLDADLIGKIVNINIVYSFNGDLESNSGDNFVLSIDENKWYTLETMVNGTPWLAQYTNAWGFELKEGRGSHYTNDFLWTPIGDPYGFQLFNRYMDVNSGSDNLGEKNKVITTYSTYYTAAAAAAYNATLTGALKATEHLTDTDAAKYNAATGENKQANDPLTAEEANNYNATLSGHKNAGDLKTPAVSAADFWEGQQIVMGDYTEHAGQATNRTVIPGSSPQNLIPAEIKTKSIYELLESSTPGYFRFHPVANTEETKYYFKPKWDDDDGDHVDNFLVRLSSSPAEFTFNLTEELLEPYYTRAGYVGGLTTTAKAGEESGKQLYERAAANANPGKRLQEMQKVVYNSKNIVPFATGYFRLHSPLGISDIDPVRYVSGYTHKTECEKVSEGIDVGKDIPMHFYEEDTERQRNFTDLKTGFVTSVATRGDLPILPVERDPASIFHFVKTEAGDRVNKAKLSTQGLYVKGVKGRVNYDPSHDNGKTELSGNDRHLHNPENLEIVDESYDEVAKKHIPERAAVVMTEEKSGAEQLFIMDLGGGVLLIHDEETDPGRAYLKYFSFDHSNDATNKSTIYDMKLTHYTHTDHAKFCMQPVQKTATKGANEMGLKLNLNNGGDGYYYATFCAPYDVLLTDKDKDAAYICRIWDWEIIHLKKVGKYNTEANGCKKEYKGSNQFVPAGTPVVIRSANTSVTLALPTVEPATDYPSSGASSFTTKFKTASNNQLEGEYLEQLLATDDREIGGGNKDFYTYDVYVFGLPISGDISKDEDYKYNGKIAIELPKVAEKGVGFYLNANPNREEGGTMGEWVRNNKYVYNNRIYVKKPMASSGSGARWAKTDFVPVVFDDDDEEDDDPIGESLLQRPHDNRVYDLLGRCVASGEEVVNGTWRSKVASGIYILNGRKIYVK